MSRLTGSTPGTRQQSNQDLGLSDDDDVITSVMSRDQLALLEARAGFKLKNPNEPSETTKTSAIPSRVSLVGLPPEDNSVMSVRGLVPTPTVTPTLATPLMTLPTRTEDPNPPVSAASYNMPLPSLPGSQVSMDLSDIRHKLRTMQIQFWALVVALLMQDLAALIWVFTH